MTPRGWMSTTQRCAERVRPSCFSLIAIALFAAGCRAPNQPIVPPNHGPVLSSIAVTPTVGPVGVQVFTFSAAATDPDSDVLTYTWYIAGEVVASGTSFTRVFPTVGEKFALVVITDGYGGAVADTVDFTVAAPAIK